MSRRHVVVVGGGAAGIFAAIAAAEAAPELRVTVLEKGTEFLQKVRISGGGRCNVTHACFEPRALSSHYPRGSAELLGPWHTFQAQDTVDWFEARGVKLKTEADRRIFPASDCSQTIVDCLLGQARQRGVELKSSCAPNRIVPLAGGGYDVSLPGGQQLTCDKVLLATGGCRGPAAAALATSLGHQLQPPVPSLFTFHIESGWVRALAGLSVAEVVAAVPEKGLEQRGAILFTHWGLSGPVILRLSAWGARELCQCDYKFPLVINWLPHLNAAALLAELSARQRTHGARLVANATMAPLPSRLWQQLVALSGIPAPTRWAEITRTGRQQLQEHLTRCALEVTGKSLNKEEFVTCGGVRLDEVNFKTMESRLQPGLYFAGELLDIDGITGGFNFQSAWTTGWIAGRSMAQ